MKGFDQRGGRPSAARRLRRFGVFELDLDAGELRKAGAMVRMQAQPLKVLCALLETPGVPLSRQALQRAVWGDTIVEYDQGLNYCISQIRRALGDQAASPCFIQTIAGSGYRFLAPCEVVDRDRDSADVHRSARRVPRVDVRPFIVVLLAIVAGGGALVASSRATSRASSAQAYLALASALERLRPAESAPNAIARWAVMKAVQVDSGGAREQLALARFRLLHDWDFDGARDAYERARQIEPRSAEVYRRSANYFAVTGQPARALSYIEKARQLDPLEAVQQPTVGWIYYATRRYPEAIAFWEAARTLQPENAEISSCLIEAYVAAERTGEALAMMGQAMRGRAVRAASTSSVALPVTVEEYYRWRLAGLMAAANRGEQMPVEIALSHARLGHREEALGWLRKGLVQRSPRMVILRTDPGFESLRSDPRFQDLASMVGLGRSL